ncbi:MAG: nitrite reductase, partial [Planctomycetota bacterium]
KRASKIYFNRCAGCHGMLRKGATGPALLPKRLKKKYAGSAGIKAVVTYGLPGGMPAWGKLGFLKDEEIDLLSRFLQHDPPSPPEMSMAEMKKTWKVYVPVDKRPKKPYHKNWQNFFGVVLRDAGKVAIIDGTTKKKISIVNTGFAVHILRSSASGRYFYSIGRDGRVTMIDLWMKKPDKVAEVKVCYDARSVDSSKFKGYEDKYLIVGGYWPPSLIIMNGQTLEPLKVVCTASYTYDTYEYQREARAAAIVSSHHDPLWVVNIKETGYIWLVDYSDIDNLKITQIPAERFLHDGGWDATHRYVLMAANARNTIVVVDTKTKKMIAKIKVGTKPHPGRGANINHPKYGPLWLTGHIGDNTIACIGVDPKGHKQYAWKVVKTIKLQPPGGGNLFIKTHPKSKWIWVDRPLHTNPKIIRTIYVINKETLEVEKRIELPKKFPGRAVHFEYNKGGDEVWVSVWAPKIKKSAIIIFDDKTLKIKKEITGDWLITPTGKFNVYNTMKDLY